MKKINSNGYAHKYLGLATLFLVAFPTFCYIPFHLFSIDIFATVMRISLGIGLLISISFVVLLTVECHQDKAINRKYTSLRRTKLAIGNGDYECQSCGNRQLKETSKECRVCGTCFFQKRGTNV